MELVGIQSRYELKQIINRRSLFVALPKFMFKIGTKKIKWVLLQQHKVNVKTKEILVNFTQILIWCSEFKKF